MQFKTTDFLFLIIAALTCILIAALIGLNKISSEYAGIIALFVGLMTLIYFQERRKAK